MIKIPDTNLRNRVSIFGLTFLKPSFVIAMALLFLGGVSGLAFAPFEYPVIWFLWIPLVWFSPAAWFKSYRAGWYFGFGHFYVNLFWLYSIHPLAVFPLAIILACFVGIWVLLFSRIQRYLPQHHLLQLLSGVGLWIMIDWLKSFIFTGFPWNFVGVALWQNPNPGIIRIAGVYGETALVITVGLALALFIKSYTQHKNFATAIKHQALSFLFVALTLSFVAILDANVKYDTFDKTFHVLAAQGNIPLCRVYTDEEFTNARDTYLELTKIPKDQNVDLVIWPETAVPAPLLQDRRYYYPFKDKLAKINKPLLVGSVDFRRDPQHPLSSGQTFNTAMLFDAQAKRLAYYDKTHPVPFGEFVPLAQYFPVLEKIIGMGRSLTAGTEHTVFDQINDAKFSVNICYEDVFPEISRQFVQNGANILMTITNDAWYNETAGSRQHFANST
ncbi:MAG: apolipoprotein N-acyltransferase, partial [Lentisphaeria bacterium]|nr:apolipoprotein N-acyltransferase [Lentisphaeria bacterium]